MNARKHTHTIAASIGVLALAGGVAATTAASASASVHQPRAVAAGSVELASPLQYESFVALQGFGHNHGYVNYTNFTYADPGSGVYAPSAGPQALVVNNAYNHTLNGGLKLIALSNNRLAFSGTGYYNASVSDTWTIRGQVNGNQVKATIAYGSWSPGYKAVLTGTIAADGSVVLGTGLDTNGTHLTWTMPKGSFFSVLSYRTPVKSDSINPRTRNATVTFIIPAGHPFAGVQVTDKVHDGGWGARHDRFTQLPGAPEQIIGGPGITVR